MRLDGVGVPPICDGGAGNAPPAGSRASVWWPSALPAATAEQVVANRIDSAAASRRDSRNSMSTANRETDGITGSSSFVETDRKRRK
jgi:hypothetical protein